MSAGWLLVITVDGYAKRVPLADIPLTGRGRRGVRVTAERHAVAGAVVVDTGDDVLVATRSGKVQRFAASDVPTRTRKRRGVRAVRLASSDAVAKVTPVPTLGRGHGGREATRRGHVAGGPAGLERERS